MSCMCSLVGIKNINWKRIECDRFIIFKLHSVLSSYAPMWVS